MDASSKMGPWMLRGWVRVSGNSKENALGVHEAQQVLTDRGCPKCQVPLMRSPNGQTPVVHFCVSCDGDPSQAPAQPSAQRSSPRISSATTVSTHLSASRASTPPTDLPSDMESPPLHPIIDTDTILRRRRQSDRASAEIGNRLLKGWAMLADECPNPECYGIPLVRPPKPGAGKDPRKVGHRFPLRLEQRDYNYNSGVRYLRLRLRRRAKPRRSGPFNSPASCKSNRRAYRDHRK